MRRWLSLVPVVLALWLVGLGVRSARHTIGPDAGVTAVAEAGVEPSLDPARVVSRPPMGRSRLEGFVGDGKGHGLPGATVCATPFGEDLVDDETVPYCTTAGESGLYAFGALPFGSYEVTASAPYRKPARAKDDVILDASAHDAVDVSLEEGGVAISGTVEDPLGRPVEGARVVASALAESEDEFASAVTATDAKGRYTLFIPPGIAYLEVFTKDHVTADRRTVAPATEDFSLAFGATLVGVVVDEANVPVPFARINLVEDGDHRSARAGADGSYRIDGLRVGEAMLDATADGLFGAALGSLHIVDGDLTAALPIVVHPIAQVVGVVRAPSGPCASGSVTLVSDGPFHVYHSASVGPHGVARWAAVQAATYRVEAVCTGFAQGLGSVVVGDRGTATFTINVLRGATVTGTVLDADGKPLLDGRVSASATKGGGYFSGDVTKGTFELKGLTPGAYDLEVRAKGHADGHVTVSVTGVETARTHVTLVRGAMLVGAVLDELGKPMIGARVSYQSKDGKGYGDADVDAKGRYSIRDLPAGDGVVRVDRGSTALALRTPLPTTDDEGSAVSLKAGARTTADLVVEACGHTLRGNVLDPSGKPVAKARVRIGRRAESGGHGFEFAEATTDATGAFAFDTLPAGEFGVRVDAPDLTSVAFVTSTPVDAAVTLKLAPLGRIVGSVAGGKGGFRVTVESTELAVYRSDSPYASGGTFVLSALPAGTYTVTVYVGEATAKEVVTLGAGVEQVLFLVPVAKAE